MAQTGLYQDIEDTMKQKPTELWTHEDVMATFDVPKQAAQNGLYNLWKAGRVQRHIDRDPDNNLYRYAISIPENKRDTYTPTKGAGKTRKKKNATIMTAKELRTMFAQLQNALAQLEDTTLQIVEAHEAQAKIIDKFNKLLEQ